MIGIIFAMKEEIEAINKISSNVSVFDSGAFKYYIFFVKNKEFVATFSGIGKANAAACTIEMINLFSVNSILNIGSCGSSNPNLSILDIVLLKKNYYTDVDATIFNYELGQIPKEKPFFESQNNEFYKKIKSILSNSKFNFFELNGGTADSFINKNNYHLFSKKITQNISCLDMESTAIAQIALKKNVDTCFLKIVSDSLFGNKKSEEEFNDNIIKISKLTFDLLSYIINNI